MSPIVATYMMKFERYADGLVVMGPKSLFAESLISELLSATDGLVFSAGLVTCLRTLSPSPTVTPFSELKRPFLS